MSSIIKKNKPRELAYLFHLMDIDDHLWGEREPTIQSLVETYRNSVKNWFGSEVISPYGFVKEQIHLIYPNYMRNYFVAEILSYDLLKKSKGLKDIQNTITQLHNSSFSAILDGFEKKALSRLNSLL